MLVTGLLMHSVDSICSIEQDLYKIADEIIIKTAIIASASYAFYKLGCLAKEKSVMSENVYDSYDNTQCISMELVEARMNLRKTDLNPKSELSMPRLELTPEAKKELRQAKEMQEKIALASEIEKFHKHHGIKK